MNNDNKISYYTKSVDDIIEYSKNLIGKKIEDIDKDNIGVEFKLIPYKVNGNSISAKNRLVLNIIDYMEEYKNTFEESLFFRKNKELLLVLYEWKEEVDRRDCIIKDVVSHKFSTEDLAIIKNDWQTIINKVKEGKAHEISEADTNYLSACPKGINSNSLVEQPFSEILAKPRAFCIKTSYITNIIRKRLYSEGSNSISILKGSKKGLEEILYDKISPYYGKSIEQIGDELGLNLISKKGTVAKNYSKILISKILEIEGDDLNKIEEFSKANINVKAIRIEKNNKIREHMLLSKFKYTEVVREIWEESKLRNTFINQRFLFIVYKYDTDNVLRLCNVKLWNMPIKILDTKIKETWEETVRVLKEGIVIDVRGNKEYDNMPDPIFNRVCHTRAHALNKDDTELLPDGREYVKKAFFLDKEYISSVILTEQDDTRIDILEDINVKHNDIYLKNDEVENYQDYNRVCECEVDGCKLNSEYAVFKFNKESKKLKFDNKYICSKHIKEYAYDKNNDIRDFIYKYLRITTSNVNQRLKTPSEGNTKDYIEAAKDIEPFVKLLMHENLSLPMTIGVFGSWGSGKTFFTNYITNRLKDIENICVINFNAWDYYDSNITVSLVKNIFTKIYDVSGVNKQLKEKNNEIESLKQQSKIKIDDLHDYIDNEEIKQLVEKKKSIFDIYKAIGYIIKINSGNLKELYRSGKELFKKNKKEILRKIILILVMIICTTSIYTFINNKVKIDNITINILKTLIFILTTLGEILVIIHPILEKFKGGIFEYKERLKISEDIKKRIKENEEELEILKRGQNLNKQNQFNIMHEKCEEYKNKAGFIANIKDDIINLQSFIEDTKIKKIVLIIDDLDRCPPNKVVEVLQSIQLLLSTELFVVTIGVDTKWINNSIESVYGDILEEGDKLFAINYIEKIIHIPFWIEELNNANSLKLIKNLSEELYNESKEEKLISKELSNSDEEAISISKENNIDDDYSVGEDYSIDDNYSIDNIDDSYSVDDIEKKEEDLNLSEEDLKILEEMDFLLDKVSPRKVKRFFNTLLLIKLRYGRERNRYKVLLFIAASIILKPELSCILYKNIVSIGIKSTEMSVQEALDKYIEESHINHYTIVFIEQYLSYINKNNIKNMSLKEFTLNIKDASRFTYYHEEIFKESTIKIVQN